MRIHVASLFCCHDRTVASFYRARGEVRCPAPVFELRLLDAESTGFFLLQSPRRAALESEGFAVVGFWSRVNT